MCDNFIEKVLGDNGLGGATENVARSADDFSKSNLSQPEKGGIQKGIQKDEHTADKYGPAASVAAVIAGLIWGGGAAAGLWGGTAAAGAEGATATGAVTADGTATGATAAGGTGGTATGATVGDASLTGGAGADTIPAAAGADAGPAVEGVDASTGQFAGETDASGAAGTGTTGGTTLGGALKMAATVAPLISAASSLAAADAASKQAKAAEALTPQVDAATPPQSQAAVDPDLSLIRKRNALLFGLDSPASTDLTLGKAEMGNLGRATLLGGSSKGLGT